MQTSETTDLQQVQQQGRQEPPHRPGSIPVTVRLDPPRYDRLKRLVRRLSTTGQSIIQTALDRSMVTLERERAPRVEIPARAACSNPPPMAEKACAGRGRTASLS